MQPRSAAGYGSEHLHKGRRDNVGKGHRPAGTGDNLQRPGAQGESRGAGRVVVWRMSPYERRRGGNAPPGGSRGRPGAGNARSGQRGSGHSVATTVGRQPDTELGSAGPASWRRGEANSIALGRRVRQHRSFVRWGKARPEKWRAEPRPEPGSGNPTVRDRREASGNVASWSLISTRRARLISISTTACTVCARHDQQLGGASPLWRLMAPTTSRWQPLSREAGWGGSRSAKSRP